MKYGKIEIDYVIISLQGRMARKELGSDFKDLAQLISNQTSVKLEIVEEILTTPEYTEKAEVSTQLWGS